MMKNQLLTALVTLCLTISVVKGSGSFRSYNSKAIERFIANSEQVSQKVSEMAPSKDRSSKEEVKYEPNWDSLDGRQLPKWFDESKIGIFIHWGVYSVPGVMNEWFWWNWKGGNEQVTDFMTRNYKPQTTYQEFAPQFTAEFYNPSAWAELFQKSGAKYVVLTSKHHEGFTLWPSKYSFSWNAKDVGPHRDLLGELADAIKNETSLKFGLYHSLYEWYNPLWVQDRANNLETDQFVRFKVLPELYEIVNKYEPEIIFSDGNWEGTTKYWQALEFLTWLYNDSPVKNTIVTNDRWGEDTMCKHGGYYSCADRFNPGVLQPRKWENCLTLDKESWGYRRNAKLEDHLTPEELITIIVESVSCGGNVLVNVGPTREGIIPPIQEERLIQMGQWLEINGEAIYNSVPWTFQNDTVTPGVWFTASPDAKTVYAMITKWPSSQPNPQIQLGAVNSTIGMTISMLGTPGNLVWSVSVDNPGIEIILPLADTILCKWVWTLKISVP